MELISAPGLIHSSLMYGYRLGSPVGVEVLAETMSASRTASSMVSTAYTFTCGYSFFTWAMNFSSEALPRPLTLMVSMFGRTAMIAASAVLLITPGPIMATTLESGLDKCLYPTPGTAPVRYAERIFADMYATGAPVSLSFSVSIRMERGKPFSLLAQLEPYHFMPAISNTPPR